MVAIDIKDTIF